MSIITLIPQVALNMATHPFVHAPAVQGLSMGTALCRFGYDRCVAVKNEPGRCKRVINAALATLALGGGLYLISKGGTYLWDAGSDRIQRAFFTADSGPPISDSLHKHEAYMADQWGPSVLHLDEANTQPKVLWLTASNDHGGDLDPSLQDNGLNKVLKTVIEQPFDFKYKVIAHTAQMCDVIQDAAKIGNLKSIIIDSHANWSALSIGRTSRLNILQQLPKQCFQNLSPKIKIILFSCFSGSGLVPLNIAEWISWISGKTVYAPAYDVDADRTLFKLTRSGELSVDFCRYDTWASSVFGGSCEPWQSMTRVFHPPVTLAENAYMMGKMGLSGLLGLFSTWQLARLGATSLQATGTLLGGVNEVFSPPTGKLARKLRIYHPLPAKALYGTVSAASQILTKTGSLTHRAMDGVVNACSQAVKKTGSFLGSKSFQTLSAFGSLQKRILETACERLCEHLIPSISI